MIYVIYGKDLGKINYYLDKIKLENSAAEQIIVDYPIDQNFLVSNIYTPPMLTSRRLVIFENLGDFSKIDFSQIHKLVDLVILQRGNFRPTLPATDQLMVIEAKQIPAIFKFLDNLIFGSCASNLTQILEILELEDSNFVFHQLTTHFRRLILAKTGNLKEKLANWQIEKYERICANVTLEKLKGAHRKLLATEIEVKTGQKELSYTLPILILKLTQIFKSL